MEMREELMHRTREVEQIVEKFLPEESGYQKNRTGGHELQRQSRRKTASPHADAGNIQAFWRQGGRD